MLTRKTLGVFLLALLSAPLTYAQQDKATISGTVFDTSGAAVPGATVTLEDTGTGARRVSKTSGAGEFVFTPLSIGTYSVTLSADGFETLVQKNLELQVQQTLDLKLTLSVGQQSRVV